MPEKSVSTESFATETKSEYSGKKLRMAIIGCGGISETHINVLKNFPDVELVAGVDIKPQRLKVMEETFGFKRLYADWKKMLKEIKPDAVNICTPNGVPPRRSTRRTRDAT
jgi:predicted dehydrogenase